MTAPTRRTFDYVLTYDRDLVLEVARSLMTRALAVTGAPPLRASAVHPRTATASPAGNRR